MIDVHDGHQWISPELHRETDDGNDTELGIPREPAGQCKHPGGKNRRKRKRSGGGREMGKERPGRVSLNLTKPLKGISISR